MSPPPVATLPTRRVAIVEDHRLLAESLDLALSVQGYDVRRIDVPDHANAPGVVLTTIVRFRPRVVLLDLDLGGFGDGLRLIGPITHSGSHVVVLTGDPDRARWGEAIQRGARKVIVKTRPLNDILAVVRRLTQGLAVMDAQEREELLAYLRASRGETAELRSRLASLTVRESEVLSHLMQGRSVREIAAAGVVSEATVRTQVKSILAKLQVSSQLAAAGLAHRVSWQAPTVG